MVTVAVTPEAPDETRVAISPETVRKLVALGCKVVIATGSGARSRFSDETYKAQGADIAASPGEAIQGADIQHKVRRPSAEEVRGHLAEGRKKDDHRLESRGVPLQRATDLETVHSRHHHVQQHEVRLHAPGDLEGDAPVARGEDPISRSLKNAHEHL